SSLALRPPPPPTSTLFPYTTLFRSGQPAALHDDDAVGVAHGRQPVRDDEHGAALTYRPHFALDDALALIVQRGCRLVEDQDARRSEEHTSELQSRENLVCRLLLEKK